MSKDWEAQAASSEHNATLNEWRQDKNNRKNKSEAAQQMLEKYIAEAFKNPNTKKNIGGEGLRSMKAGQRGENPVRDAKVSSERFGGVVTEEDFTGINQEMPWDRD
jgi:hypothetical protein